VKASEGALVAEATGEVEKTQDGVLVVRRIHVHYRLEASPDQAGVVDRVHSFHAQRCPVARTLAGCVEVSTSYDLVPPGPHELRRGEVGT
jgi:uncharacterized OsmC-like protein